MYFQKQCKNSFHTGLNALNSFAAGHLHRLNKKKKIAAQKQNTIDSDKPVEKKRAWLRFSFSQSMKSGILTLYFMLYKLHAVSACG
jgi:hypothetical protein